MYQVVFKMNCGTCNQSLDPLVSDAGVEYKHGNAEDCSEPSVVLPVITPEMLVAALGTKKKASKPKAVSKKR